MKSWKTGYLVAACLLLVLSEVALAHGGQYRGAGDMIYRAIDGGPPGQPRPPRPPRVGPDLSKWQFWWEFNKENYLGLQNSAKPSPKEIQTVILPALHRTLATTHNRDITSSSMLAMVKIDQHGEVFNILEICKKKLANNDQEIRETAALCLGILGRLEALGDLMALATDSKAGRKLIGRKAVDLRTRSFATYAMGLLAYDHDSRQVKSRVFMTLKLILERDKDGDRNILVAAINAMGLLNWNLAKDQALLEDTLESLDGFYDLDAPRPRQLIQSHVPAAIAKLLGRGNSKLHQKYKEKFAHALFPKKRITLNLYRGAALALGQMVLANETGNEPDSKYSEALLKYYREGRDSQSRYFCLMALGQIGGKANQDALLEVLATGSKALQKPWAAMALGILSFHKMKEGVSTDWDKTIPAAIHKQFLMVRNPETLGAFSVALGLCKYQDAAEDMLNMLGLKQRNDELSGYLCIGLALMDYKKAKPYGHKLMLKSPRRPYRLQKLLIAQSKQGDKAAVRVLLELLQLKTTNLVQLSAIAQALGTLGDGSSIEPLTKILANEELTDLSRAFAATALGCLADKENLPWNAKISRNMNYRAAVETLMQSGTGVLDIL